MPKRRTVRETTKNTKYWGRTYFPPSRPIPIESGIKAKSQRGNFVMSWWGTKFIALLESFGWENRLQRGKTYARKGQVVSIKIGPGTIVAKVQGSMPKPYSVQITQPPFQTIDWDKITKALAKKAVYAAQLLTGELPNDIDVELDKLGYNLLPKKSDELKMECSCPDYANPCKHLAAVYYLVAERFDADPFVMFTLRGISKEKFLEKLKTNRMNTMKESIPSKQEQGPNTTSQKKTPVVNTEISASAIQSFWGITTQQPVASVPPPLQDNLHLLEVLLVEQTKDNHAEIKNLLLRLKKHLDVLNTKI